MIDIYVTGEMDQLGKTVSPYAKNDYKGKRSIFANKNKTKKLNIFQHFYIRNIKIVRIHTM